MTEAQTIVVYTDKLTNRLRYACELIFKHLLGVEVYITTDVKVFADTKAPKLSYRDKPLADELFIDAAKLLFERRIKDFEPEVEKIKGLSCLFPHKNERSALPFDPFAAAFWLVTRYEEYLPFVKDEHGRFQAEDSLAYRKGFLKVAVVNRYANWLRDIIKERFRGFEFPVREYKYTPTYDIDSAYAFLSKGLFRAIGGFGKSLVQLDLPGIADRFKALSHLSKDPFDVYDWLNDFHKEHGLKPIYFFHMGDYDEYDKGISYLNTRFRNLVKSTADHSRTGIHPSYASGEDTGKMKMEIKRLSEILNREISKSRQHFLRLQMPKTYEQLIESDIQRDYTMGYASRPGFRASICSPYPFFNLDLDIKTPLMIYPFQIMDATFQYYQHMTEEEMMETMDEIIAEVKAVKGTLITLWHNNSLSEHPDWAKWKTTYTLLVEEALR